MVFSVALRPSDGLPAHLAEDLLLQLGLNSAGREQKTDIWLESRYIGCVTSITEDQARWGRGGLQQSEKKHLQATMGFFLTLQRLLPHLSFPSVPPVFCCLVNLFCHRMQRVACSRAIGRTETCVARLWSF